MKFIGETSEGHDIYINERPEGIEYISSEIGGGSIIWIPSLGSVASMEFAIKHFKETQCGS